LAAGYIALPGGYGTLEELFEAVCWGQLAFHQSPVAVLNVHGYYDGLITLIDHMVDADFLSEDCRTLMTVASTVDDLESWLNVCFQQPV
ncbi:MAG: LOG family protein, partial [Fuerstiella sp.]|nr:LOG family protein [Fuerstiella sp.]